MSGRSARAADQRLGAARGISDHLDAGVRVEQVAQTTEDDFTVVEEEDPDRPLWSEGPCTHGSP